MSHLEACCRVEAKYPKGTRFTAWSSHTENQKGTGRVVIRRWVTLPNGTKRCERLPTAKYAHFRDKPDELAAYLIRLNAEHVKEQRVRAGVEVRHAYIDEQLLTRYEKRRRNDVPAYERVTTEMTHIRKHVIGFFVSRLGLQSPRDWHRVHKDEWADYLLKDKDVPRAPSTKRDIIQACNRFVAFLHEQRPTEVPELKFKPISKDKFKSLRSERDIDPKIKKRTWIRPEHWATIVKNLPPEIAPFVMLAYNYGIRRSEALGVLPGDVKRNHLSVERQLKCLEPEAAYKPTKGKLKRDVEHWFATAAQAYEWVESAQKHRIDPDHLTELWNDLMQSLNYTYAFHDLRHAFITRALKDKSARQVQLAAGHQHIKTTMGYAHDDRELGNEVYKPGAA